MIGTLITAGNAHSTADTKYSRISRREDCSDTLGQTRQQSKLNFLPRNKWICTCVNKMDCDTAYIEKIEIFNKMTSWRAHPEPEENLVKMMWTEWRRLATSRNAQQGVALCHRVTWTVCTPVGPGKDTHRTAVPEQGRLWVAWRNLHELTTDKASRQTCIQVESEDRQFKTHQLSFFQNTFKKSTMQNSRFG